MNFSKKLLAEGYLNFDILQKAIDFYEEELEEARKEVRIHGSLEKNAIELPGILEYRFSQYQDLESIVDFIERRINKKKSEKFIYYMENYNRSLSSRDAEKYAEADEEIVTLYDLLSTFKVLKGNYMGILKALDSKGFQINNLIRLKSMNLEI